MKENLLSGALQMRKAVIIALVLLAITAAVTHASAQKYPAAAGYIADTVGVMDAATKDKLTAMLRALHEKTTAQAAVAIVDTTGGVSIEEYAAKLFQKWGIGTKGKDNGVLLVVAVEDRKMKIEVGYGLEGAIPDGVAGGIIDNVIKPYFKSGDMNGGIAAGMEAIVRETLKEYDMKPEDIGLTAGQAAQPPAPTPTVSRFSLSDLLPFIFVFGVIILVILIIIIKGAGAVATEGNDNGGLFDGNDSGDSDSSSDSSDSFDGGASGGGGASGDW